ncbi:hypothetical protein ABPG75_005160 [Micractinium tetrahymenae]
MARALWCAIVRSALLDPRMAADPITEQAAEAVSTSCGIKRLPQKANHAVLSQLLALEKRLFKKADNWGDLLVKETQRRNTFLLYAEAPAAEAPTAGAAAAPAPQSARLQKGQSGGKAAGPPSPQHPAAVVGYIIFTATGLNAHISKLAVATEWRRSGIARALVRAAVAAARTERRVASVSLHVDADNAPALGLYLSEGFASEALLKDYYCRGRHAHKMRLDLDSAL